MPGASASPPRCLVRGLLRVDDPLLRERTNAALAALELPPTELSLFHLDAAGWSPEIAAERQDPFYLGGARELGSAGMLVSVAQLDVPLVHPAFGYAADAYRRVVSGARREIAALLLREPLVAELRHATRRLRAPRELADLEHFDLGFRTPGGLVQARHRLDDMKREFLESDRLWLDDAFLAELASVAARVRDLAPLPASLVGSRHPLALFYLPLFGGSYVVEEPGASRSAGATTVLCADCAAPESPEQPSARGRRVELRPLRAEDVVALLLHHGVARLDVRALRRAPEKLERVCYWAAVAHLAEREAADATLPSESAALGRWLGELREPPEELAELLDLRRRLAARDSRLSEDALSPLSRLRLLTPTTSRAEVRRLMRHLQAFVDTADLEGAWRDAPDLFFARWPRLSEARRRHFARWLEGGGAAG
jgi:hypothetical protein